ncbi:hypothetical protein D5086_006431 [Populus alba]|uniref:Uncharacterized protein n=1 Tax=Populus alba TaxID=43335 RepID=A0ACC4CKP7_POPAL
MASMKKEGVKPMENMANMPNKGHGQLRKIGNWLRLLQSMAQENGRQLQPKQLSIVVVPFPGEVMSNIFSVLEHILDAPCKKINQKGKQTGVSTKEDHRVEKNIIKNNLDLKEENKPSQRGEEESKLNFNVDDFFDFSNEDPLNLEWMSRFLEIDKA